MNAAVNWFETHRESGPAPSAHGSSQDPAVSGAFSRRRSHQGRRRRALGWLGTLTGGRSSISPRPPCRMTPTIARWTDEPPDRAGSSHAGREHAARIGVIALRLRATRYQRGLSFHRSCSPITSRRRSSEPLLHGIQPRRSPSSRIKTGREAVTTKSRIFGQPAQAYLGPTIMCPARAVGAPGAQQARRATKPRLSFKSPEPPQT